MNDVWNQRYAMAGYAYGTEPNAFLAEHAALLSGPVLSLAEGEGRNAVFLASRGLQVHGVDLSEVGLAKAQALAQVHGVRIETEVTDLATFEPAASRYGSVVSVFAHLPGVVRQRLCPLLERALKPGGLILLEAYAQAQLGRDTGGPKDPDMLMSVEKILREFPGLEPVLLREVEREVHEGVFHTGMASVVQFIGRKKADGRP